MAFRDTIKNYMQIGLAYGGADGFWRLINRSRHKPVVLAYHRVVKSGGEDADVTQGYVNVEQFERQIQEVTNKRRAVTVAEWLGKGSPVGPYVMVTFDDGYKDNLENAFPILEKYGVAASLYVTTDAVAGRRALWWDRLSGVFAAARGKAVDIDGRIFQIRNARDQAEAQAYATALWKRDPERDAKIDRLCDLLGVDGPMLPGMYLGWDQIRGLSDAGWEIGAHTRTHRVLTTLTAAELEEEVAGAAAEIAAALGKRPTTLSYPNGRPGDFNVEVKAMLRAAGFRGALTMLGGLVEKSGDVFEIPRVVPKSWESPAVFRMQLSGLYYRLKGR